MEERDPLKAPPSHDSLPPPASQAELDLITARKAMRAREQQTIEKGRALWPDIRPDAEKNQPDISTITRNIARSS